MRGKAGLLVGLSVGYVLGTRDGRERYEQLKSKVDQVRKDPRVRAKADQAQAKAREAAGVATDKASAAASQASGSVKAKLADRTGDESDDDITPAPNMPPAPAPVSSLDESGHA